MSERKRQALRRTQQAAAEARRRAVEDARERDQMEYLGIVEGQAGTELAGEVGAAIDPTAIAEGNAPGVEISPPEPELVEDAVPPAETDSDAAGDINSIREELKRRQDESQ